MTKGIGKFNIVCMYVKCINLLHLFTNKYFNATLPNSIS